MKINNLSKIWNKRDENKIAFTNAYVTHSNSN